MVRRSVSIIVAGQAWRPNFDNTTLGSGETGRTRIGGDCKKRAPVSARTRPEVLSGRPLLRLLKYLRHVPKPSVPDLAHALHRDPAIRRDTLSVPASEIE
jgi:hypothetical protein